VAFGKPIFDLQGIQFKLAGMQTKTAAARELLYKACALADADSHQLAMYSSMAKLFASDTAMDVTIEAIQVLGGHGYVRDHPLERMIATPRSRRSTKARTRSRKWSSHARCGADPILEVPGVEPYLAQHLRQQL
jgi:alkylation response protein AidB-like acyl-CoA dehydrogenase